MNVLTPSVNSMITESQKQPSVQFLGGAAFRPELPAQRAAPPHLVSGYPLALPRADQRHSARFCAHVGVCGAGERRPALVLERLRDVGKQRKKAAPAGRPRPFSSA